ncbi:hypothetical protein [Archangium lipolyticum]|uniref:hypothetical protein n=1 Tax=Archangium lipolyticum TaxID=2970465 RepID=UPI00214A28E6|nr:hypothetical protein [Archangium lipolyticum]
MALMIAALIRRNMKESTAFKVSDGHSAAPLSMELPAGESLVGWYKNPPPWEESLVAFTDKAIYALEKQQIVRIALDDIIDCESPPSKNEAVGVRVRTRDGFRFIRMAGSRGPQGKFKDVFDLLMILKVIIEANQRRAHHS